MLRCRKIILYHLGSRFQLQKDVLQLEAAMHFSTATYISSVLSLFALQSTALAPPTSNSPRDTTHSTTSNRACHQGTYSSFTTCKINCGTGTSAGNCTKITSMLVKDSPPYDCTCPGDEFAILNNDQSQTQLSKSQPPLRKVHPRWLSAQNLQLQARTAQQQHQQWFVEKAFDQPRAMPRKPCKRGYHKNIDTCMANCGGVSGNCINYQHVDGGHAVACQCKPGDL